MDRPAPRRRARHTGVGRIVVHRHLDRVRGRVRRVGHAVAHRLRAQACTLPVGLALEFIVFLTVSTTIGRERPDVTPLGSVPSTSSFPSGHVAAGVVLYGGLVLIAASITKSNAVARRTAIPAAVVIAYVASARVYEGVHHPSDVIAGAVLGMGALLVAAVSTGLVVPTRRATGVRPPVGRRRVEVTRS